MAVTDTEIDDNIFPRNCHLLTFSGDLVREVNEALARNIGYNKLGFLLGTLIP
jgi:hypothetical protein